MSVNKKQITKRLLLRTNRRCIFSDNEKKKVKGYLITISVDYYLRLCHLPLSCSRVVICEAGCWREKSWTKCTSLCYSFKPAIYPQKGTRNNRILLRLKWNKRMIKYCMHWLWGTAGFVWGRFSLLLCRLRSMEVEHSCIVLICVRVCAV